MKKFVFFIVILETALLITGCANNSDFYRELASKDSVESAYGHREMFDFIDKHMGRKGNIFRKL